MPCDRLHLLFDYARLCAQTPGDSYEAAQCLPQTLPQQFQLGLRRFPEGYPPRYVRLKKW